MLLTAFIAILMVICGGVAFGSALMAFAGGGSNLLGAIALAFGVIAFLCGHAIFA